MTESKSPSLTPERNVAQKTLQRQMNGYTLTTAEILYHMPDHPSLIQSFVWQNLDMAPRFPILTRFLDFWESNLDGKLHSVRVAHSKLVKPATFRYAKGMMQLH